MVCAGVSSDGGAAGGSAKDEQTAKPLKQSAATAPNARADRRDNGEGVEFLSHASHERDRGAWIRMRRRRPLPPPDPRPARVTRLARATRRARPRSLTDRGRRNLPSTGSRRRACPFIVRWPITSSSAIISLPPIRLSVDFTESILAWRTRCIRDSIAMKPVPCPSLQWGRARMSAEGCDRLIPSSRSSRSFNGAALG